MQEYGKKEASSVKRLLRRMPPRNDGAPSAIMPFMSNIRTRFAPSPTGYLHVGGARTALFNWLYAHNTGGKFILRVEDTDLERSTTEAVDAIFEGMKWLGLNWDEGPFFQSKRLDLYQKYAKQLIDAGKAYEKEGAVFFKTTIPKEADLVIMKSDGMPTYHFGVVIDDWQMDITHVIRGSDHIANTPKHVMIFDALGVKPPEFIHVPMILGSDGQRLSKRHGATSVLAYREEGFLPEALINYLVRLGWAHGDQEIFSIEELIEKFSLDKLGRSAGIFDPQKLTWLNCHYIKHAPADRLLKIMQTDFNWQLPGDARDLRIIDLLKERSKMIPELIEGLKYFYVDQIAYDTEVVEKHLTPENCTLLNELLPQLEAIGQWLAPELEKVIRGFTDSKGIKASVIIHPLRAAVTGKAFSPGIFETLELIGKDKVLSRLASLPVAG
jgi:glutamyl-tRNA synthetase